MSYDNFTGDRSWRRRLPAGRVAHTRALLLRVVAFGLLVPFGTALPQAIDSSRSQAGYAAHATTGADALDSFVALARTASPTVKAAAARAEAARHGVSPAGTLPDPTLMAGVQNLPLGNEPGMSGPDPMTMRMIGATQTIPYPGRLRLRRRLATRELGWAQAALDAARRRVVRDVKDLYYELAFLDQALAIVSHNRDVLAGLIRVTETRYGVGTAGQQDVLKARVEATRLAETAVTLTEQRRAVLARFNALLDRPGATPVAQPAIPPRVASAAVAPSADAIRFTSAALGARVADSPLPPLEQLQDAAIRESPELREHEAMIAAQAARLDLARMAARPDVDVSLQYGQRGGGRPDMLSAILSVPLPVFKGRKQDQLVGEADAQLQALHAEHEARVNELRAEVAGLVAEAERSRAQLALYVKALLPQAHASLASATASYQAGRLEFRSVLDDQATVFTYETDYFRALSDFAKKVAELDRVVGREILP